MEKNEFEEDVLDTSIDESIDNEAESDVATEEEALDYKALYEAEKGRRKRAETDLEKSKSKVEVKTTSNSSLSEEEIAKKVKDTIIRDRLVEENELTDEELQEIEEFASIKKITLSEAVKSPVVKRIIEDAKEIKRSRELTSTGNSRVGSAKISDTQLLAKANSGKPLSDEELTRLARM